MVHCIDSKARQAKSNTVKHLQHPKDIQRQNVVDGDVVQQFDHRYTWGTDCLDDDTCVQWRTEADPLCDAALDEMFFARGRSPAGLDLYHALALYVEKAKAKSSAARAFWNEVNRRPPLDLIVSDKDAKIAQELYLDCSMQITLALLYYSLAGGFASPRIVRTLRAISYLVSPSENPKESQAAYDRTYARLLETFQFVIDAMGCSVGVPKSKCAAYLLPGGEGWKAAIRVRMLHGVARARVHQRWSKNGSDLGNYVAISQEDMSGTLASFSTIPLWTLSLLGVAPSTRQAEAYLAVWRHVGFYLGVRPDIISKHFCNVSASDHFLASIALHLFAEDENQEHRLSSTSPTLAILKAVSDRPPLRSSIEYNYAMARRLLGTELANHLGIPDTTSWMGMKLNLSLFVQNYPVVFGKVYGRIRPGWVQKRRYVMREGIARSLRFAMGMRKTVFRPREEDAAELDEVTKEKEKVRPDPEGAKLLVGSWRAMLAEMIVVSVVAGLSLGYCGWRAMSYLPTLHG